MRVLWRILKGSLSFFYYLYQLIEYLFKVMHNLFKSSLGFYMSRVAIAQMISSDNVMENLHQVEKLCLLAKNSEASLLILPENFAFMGKQETQKLALAEKMGDGPIQQRISNLASRHKLWVIAGTIPINTDSARVSSSSMVFNDDGLCVAHYNKIHLFDVKISDSESYQESQTIEPGNDAVVVDTPVGKIGLSICYDLRFPELYHHLILKGAEILSIPSAFTAITGRAHWEILLCARAIENLAYVLAPNQGGKHANGRSTYGHSMIVEPWGKVVIEKQTGAGIIAADVDLARLRRLRKDFPCNEHHKFKVIL
jgi:predicted amidohydrolase